MTTLFSFGVGAAGIVFPERSTPERLFELIEQHRPTIMVNVPTMMAAMLEYPGAEDRDLSSLRLCISSGEALPDEMHRRWLEVYGVEVLEGIGSSELYHIYISNRPARVRLGSTGELVPGYEGRLLDGAGQPVPDGVPGELWASGESAALCYWSDHEKSKFTFHGDTVRTGDLFERDRDGYFWYRGRADDLLKVGGIWVAPLEMENCLLRHPAVAECAVVGYEEQGSGAAARVCRATRRNGVGRARDGAAGVRPGRALAAQVPARRPVRRRAAEDRLGEDRPAHAEGRRAPGDGGLDELGAMAYVVGIDIGGTCTDCVVVDEKGGVTLGKAFSTPPDFSGGIVDALGVAADELGLGVGELLSETRLFLHSTTVAENAVVDGTLASAGVITSRGFEDTLFAMRGRLRTLVGAHRGREAEPDRDRQARRRSSRAALIVGIGERTDATGDGQGRARQGRDRAGGPAAGRSGSRGDRRQHALVVRQSLRRSSWSGRSCGVWRPRSS